jgi:hypothetical protein
MSFFGRKKLVARFFAFVHLHIMACITIYVVVHFSMGSWLWLLVMSGSSNTRGPPISFVLPYDQSSVTPASIS